MPLLNYIKEISPLPILFIAGENSHSRYMCEVVFTAASEPIELLIIPGAVHVDLHYRLDVVPFEEIAVFFKENLK